MRSLTTSITPLVDGHFNANQMVLTASLLELIISGDRAGTIRQLIVNRIVARGRSGTSHTMVKDSTASRMSSGVAMPKVMSENCPTKPLLENGKDSIW
mmetsp:Transcript_10495/g.11428  ORF Transcript_10495/g.11428 Transcript_10495/m.11428 type:complete len:98 (+) Transcript_10495:756-1049(+)